MAIQRVQIAEYVYESEFTTAAPDSFQVIWGLPFNFAIFRNEGESNILIQPIYSTPAPLGTILIEKQGGIAERGFMIGFRAEQDPNELAFPDPILSVTLEIERDV